MKQIILGTAGHIDHGKTALIRALTGIDTDRLKEEKRRGITIELGFAHLALPSGNTLGIVDVPGHERFVKNMVVGATGIDLVAIIIAADEGVMPQTREHLEICKLLNITYGFVVITKIDLVDDDWLSLVRDDISTFLEGTFLENAPVVEVSSETGEGIDEVVHVLDELTRNIPERSIGTLFRLPIDRVFTMKGFGTVVTGTTISGHIDVGSEVTIYPRGIASKIRGIQVHNKEVSSVRAGSRTAINLQGVEKAQIVRGDVVAQKDSLKPTYMIDAVLEYLPSNPKKFQNRKRIRFHCGSSEIIAMAVLLDRDELQPGETCFAQFRLEKPTVVRSGDRFVIRSYSPVRTIGGGHILNPLPGKKKRFSPDVLSDLAVLKDGTDRDIIEQHIKMGKMRGLTIKEISFLTSMSKDDISRIIEALSSDGIIISYDPEKAAFIHAAFYSKAKEMILAIVSDYHNSFPLKEGLAKEELRSRIRGNMQEKLFNKLLNDLIAEQAIVRQKDIIHAKAHKVTLHKEQEASRAKIEAIYRKAGLEPPYFKDLDISIQKADGKEVLETMVKDGTLIKVKEDLYFHNKAIEDLKAKLIDYIKHKGEITTPELKALTGVSRKYTIPLIEYFDKNQVTVRIGDKRILRKSR